MNDPRCSYCYQDHPPAEICEERSAWLRADDEYDRRVDLALEDRAEGRSRG